MTRQPKSEVSYPEKSHDVITKGVPTYTSIFLYQVHLIYIELRTTSETEQAQRTRKDPLADNNFIF